MADEQTITTTDTVPQPTKEDIMWQEIWNKVDTLSSNLKFKVYPIVIIDLETPGEYVIGYARKPDMTTQLRLIDKSEGNVNGIALEPASAVLESLILSTESDKRITDKDGEYYDQYWKGACYSLKQFMTLAVPVIKKK